MALIDKKLVTPRETASYKLDCKTIELVRFYSEFIGKEGQILRGVVHRIEKRNVILEVGKAEAILPEREQIPGERYNPGDRIRACMPS